MSLIRGIRSVIHGYSRDHEDNSGQNEDIVSSMVLETSDEEEPYVRTTNEWPESIVLTAKMVPEKNFDVSIFVEIFSGAGKIEKNYIYSSPIFHSASEIKNKNDFCSRLLIKYESAGEFIVDNGKNSFFGNDFDDYKLDFPMGNGLFVKEFQRLTSSVEEQYDGRIPHTGNRIFSYGGFFKYGAHPQEIEPCFFQILLENSKTAIRIVRSKKLFANYCKEVNELSEFQKNTLYEDFLSGSCKFSLMNKCTCETCIYKSCALQHIVGTDLIKINFIKDEGK